MTRADLLSAASAVERKGLERAIRDFFAPSTVDIAPMRCLRVLDAMNARMKNEPGNAAWLNESRPLRDHLRARYSNPHPKLAEALARLPKIKITLGSEAAAAVRRVSPPTAETLASELVRLLLQAGFGTRAKRKLAIDVLTSYLATPVR